MNPPNQNGKTPTFRDGAGRVWNLAINIGLARRVRDEMAVDFGQVTDGQLFITLSDSPEKLAGTLWLLVERQAERQSVTPEDFAESLDGDALDGAMEALAEAIILFSRSHQRQAVRTLLKKTMVAQEKIAKAAEEWIEANADRITGEVIDQAITAMPTSGANSPS